MPRLTVAQALVAFLAAQWSERDGERERVVPATFGIFGHGNVCSVSAALAEQAAAMPFHAPKHEQAMVHTALGFAKARRRLATLACTASIGPGATNLVTGAATATTNRLPVLLLPADTFATRRSGTVLQQLQHPAGRDWTVNECLRPVSRFFDRVARPEQLLDALPAAIGVLLDPADTGAVTVALHQDVAGEAFDFPEAFLAPRIWHVPRPEPDPAQVAAAAALIREAERPLVIAGGGVWHAGAEAALEAFAGPRGIPVAETSAGKGTARGEMAVGGIGVNGTHAANALAADADVVVCVGTRLSDFTTGSRALFADPRVRLVGVNVAAADARAAGGLPVVGDARPVLERLADALGGWAAPPTRAAQARAAMDRWRAAVVADVRPRAGERMSQAQVLQRLNAATGPGDWVVAAAGSPPGDILKLWDVPPGGRAHIEFGFSCMGHEIPAGLGIRMAEPGAGRVLVVIGDGTFLMAPTELVTAVELELPVTVIVCVNGGYQSIHSLQLTTTGISLGNEFGVAVDHAALAEALGCPAWSATTPEELDAALQAADAQLGPALIACAVEPRRMALASECWWDLGVAEASTNPRTRELAAAHAAGRGAQRYLA